MEYIGIGLLYLLLGFILGAKMILSCNTDAVKRGYIEINNKHYILKEVDIKEINK